MSWLSKATGIHIGGGWGVSKAINRGYDFATSAGKRLATQYGAFSVNFGTLGLVRPKWSGTATASKAGRYTGYAAAAVAGGYGAASLFSTPAVGVVEAGTALAPETALASGLELEAAAGSGMGVWVEPVATGAGTGLSSVFSSIGAGLKTGVEALGIKGLFAAALQSGGERFSSFADREINNLVSGESGSSGGVGPALAGEQSRFAILPIVAIGVVILGLFYFIGRKKIGGP